MKIAPTDSILLNRGEGLSDHDRRRIILMREQSPLGALEVSLRAHIRPAGSSRKFTQLHSATTNATVKAALNAEQIITGGPIAGRNFVATNAMLELYEQTYREKKNTK